MIDDEQEKQRSPDCSNVFDKVIGFISPYEGFRRLAWRQAFDEKRGAYIASDKTRSSDGWTPVNASAEQTNQNERDFIRARARERERNSDMFDGILLALERNVIGTGFILQSKVTNEKGEPDENINKQIESLFAEWCDKENCDVTGGLAFWEHQKMVLRRTKVDGGILYVKAVTDDKRFPFKLQAREVDDLSSNGLYRNPENQNKIINGIEVDKNNKPVAYWLKETSPDGWFTGKSIRLEANRVIFPHVKKRPTEIREMSNAVTALPRINDIEELIDSVSMKEKILSALAIFIKRAIPTTGRTSITATPNYDPKTGYKKKTISPGMIEELMPGDEVQAVIPAGQATNTRDYACLLQRIVGAGQGLSYEASSRDMSQVNYSSARQGLLEDQKTHEDWQQWLIDHFLKEIYKEFVEYAVLSGEIKIKDFSQNKSRYLKHEWIPPGWGWIDPKKEVEANNTAIRSGQTNLSNVCARSGFDWRETLEQRAKEIQFVKGLEEKYKIKFDLGGGEKDAKEPKEGVSDED